MRRRFNQRERIAAFLVSGGQCEQCGQELRRGYHADHKIPYSKGGKTNLSNILALCPSCNLKKGNKMITGLGSWKYPMRDWQEEAWARYQRKTDQSFLAVATPGAGKTMFALRVAYESLATNKADRIAIVAPTRHLCVQWSQAAHRIGLNISVFDNQRLNERDGFNGSVSTYQSVASKPEVYSLLCQRNRTFTIFDEIHHASDDLSWGLSLKEAFGASVSMLALSGTPFRSDNSQIPFVRYHEGISQADYEYSYKQALIDGVCRTVLFPTFEGDVAWLEDDEYRSVSFSDVLDERMARRRLRMAVRTQDYVEGLVLEANETLQRLRANQQPDAGGLLIATDIRRAKEACDVIQKVTGTKPFLATSDESELNGSEQIKQFAKGSAPWIVAVKMISEGVDIPRLRVLVWATDTTTELFFRQAVGRVVRVIPNAENPTAFVYLPEDPKLVEFARLIMDERGHEIEEIDDDDNKNSGPMSWEMPIVKTQLIPHTGNAVASNTIYMGDQIDKSLLAEAEEYGKQLGFATPQVKVLLSLFHKSNGKRNEEKVDIDAAKVNADPRTLNEKTDDLQRLVNAKVKQLAGYIKGDRDLGKTISSIWYRLRQLGFNRVNRCSYSELEEMKSVIDRWIAQSQKSLSEAC